MKLDVTQLLNKRKSEMDFSFELLPSPEDDFAILPEGVSLDSPARIDCVARDVNGYIHLDFTVCADLTVRCSRCLDEFPYELTFSFQRFAGNSPEAVWGDEDEDEREDVLEISDSAVLPDRAIMEELSLAAPEYALCSDDCPGLCPRCGKKKNLCSCTEKEEGRNDPRMDVFRDLLRRMEEEEEENSEKSENN